jgi:hypothetical protein
MYFDIAGKFFWFALGVLAKYLVRGSFWDSRTYLNWRANREYERVMKAIDKSMNCFEIGAFKVDEISVLPLLHGIGRGLRGVIREHVKW